MLSRLRAAAIACAVVALATAAATPAQASHRHHVRHSPPHHRAVGSVIAHPAGCPPVAFCGCGAAIRIFGRPVRNLWLAANWFRFPHTSPAPGMAAVRRHHVFVLERQVSGTNWLVFDANSGGHQTRIHVRSIAGFTIVNPKA